MDALEIDKPTDAMYLLVGAKQIYFKRNYYDMDKRTYALAKPRLRRIKRKQKWQKFWEKHGGAVITFGFCGTALTLVLIGAALSENKRRQINAKVSAYEKTLPEYLEQKQQVE
ncbi:MAG: hypothetical protein IKZ64_01975, partial [Alphaproteobacteria bacterium]|nr:hypothetical protein [Alphaproteobacteria bacterium]